MCVSEQKQIEVSTHLEIDFDKLSKIGMSGHKVIPVVVQNAATKEVSYCGIRKQRSCR
ncbi:MAG: hypothetical protein CM15mP49_36760 [Actinomycetota bacterium]|nr:MAG: hypothetical protein CM15mP49_36760 [Actinomycetota bacterium]